jgi:iron(III) transport system substrate-binding protein
MVRNTEVARKHNLPAPASWADLTGYLSVASILPRMGEAEGWKYLDALDQNIAEYTKSGSKPCKDAAAGERGIGVSFEYVALEMKTMGAPVEMVLPREGSGYGMEANALPRKGAANAAARPFLDGAIGDEAMGLYAKFFAAVGVAGLPVPEGLPRFPNDFHWSAKNRERILAEWQKRYAK